MVQHACNRNQEVTLRKQTDDFYYRNIIMESPCFKIDFWENKYGLSSFLTEKNKNKAQIIKQELEQ